MTARRAFAVLALLAAFAVPLGSAGAQTPDGAPEIEVGVTFTPPAATLGDRLTLTVRARHDADVVVTVQRPTLFDAELLADGRPSIEPQPDGRVMTTATFRYQVFTLGEVATGPIEVRWLIDDGTSGVLEVAGGTLRVIATRAEGDEALRPLKPQAVIDGAPPVWIAPVAIAVAVVAAVAALVVAVVRWRRRPRRVEVEAPLDVPEAAARERLHALRNARLDDEAEFQAYYGTIAAVVRGYLGARFGFNAAALTTSELERRMTSHGVDRWQARLVGGLLDRCDRAVYARRYPEPASADHDLTVAYEIVELSRPRPVAVEEDTAVAS
ncbi:MAG: hypothetical protein WD058_08955 [Dehalococcoidia bacterium]